MTQDTITLLVAGGLLVGFALLVALLVVAARRKACARQLPTVPTVTGEQQSRSAVLALDPQLVAAATRAHAEKVRRAKIPADQCTPQAQAWIADRIAEGRFLDLYPSGSRTPRWWYVDEDSPWPDLLPGHVQWCAAVYVARLHLQHGWPLPAALARMALAQVRYTMALLWDPDTDLEAERELHAIRAAAEQQQVGGAA